MGVTTWPLLAYTGTWTTTTTSTVSDGYKITASLTWQDVSAVTATPIALSNEAASSGDDVVIGTCVETIDKSTGAALASTVTTQGNFAMCHWMYFDYGTNTAVTTLSGTTDAWGDSKFLATAAWGTNGGAVTGAGAAKGGNSQGTSLTLAANGLAFAP